MMNAIRTISTLIFPLITFPYTSRVLGPEGAGHLSFAFSFVGYFIFLASLGIPLYGIREVAKVREDRDSLVKLTQELLALHMGASIVSTLILVVVILSTGKIYQEHELFLVVSTTVILSSVGLEWLYQGLEEYTYITVRSIIFSILSTASIFIFIHDNGDYVVSAIITIVATVGSNLLNFYNARKIVFGKIASKIEVKRHLKPLLNVYLMNFVISLYVNLDIVFLGFLSTAKSVGIYSTAMKLIKIILSVVTSLGSVLMPRLSYYIEKSMRQEFDLLLSKSLSLVLLLSVPLSCAMVILGRQLVLIMAGPKYLESYSCIVIASPIIVFIALTSLLGIQILYPMGEDKKVTFTVTVGAFCSLLLNMVLIPIHDYVGAAIARFFSELAVLIAQLLIVRKYYRVNWPWSNIAKYVISSAVMSGLLLVTVMIVPNMPISLCLSVPAGTVVYFIMLNQLKEPHVMEIKEKLFNKLSGRNHYV